MRIAAFLRRYRIAALALALSALVHAAVFVSIPNYGAGDLLGGDDSPEYTATLDAEPSPGAPAPAAKPSVKRVAHPRPKFQPVAVPDEIAPVAADPLPTPVEAPVIAPV